MPCENARPPASRRPRRPEAGRTPQERALNARIAVWHALDRLPPRRRAVLVLHELEGLTIPAIASLLGVTAITVRWHLSKGRRDLMRALEPQMGDTP
jgi:RNA polymerase sigma-70 factor (ECF subfamily)